MRINDFDSISIFGWMRTKLNLDKIDLIVFAKMYGDGQDGGPIPNDVNYLSDLTGFEKQDIINSLKRLEDMKLIEHKDYYRDVIDCYIITFHKKERLK